MDLGLDDAGAYYSRPRPMSYAGSSRPYGFGGLGYGSPTYAYSIDPYQQRALLEEQRRKELLEEQKRRELLELEREKERRRLEEERIRKILQEERQREEEAIRQRMLEEERMRRAVEEEKLRRAMEEERMRRALREEEEARRERQRSHSAGHLRSPSQQASLEPLLRALGFVPATSGSDSESDKVSTCPLLYTNSMLTCIQETPRGRPSQGPRRNVPSPSPIRPYPFGRPSQRSEAAPASTIPITSPKFAAKPKPIPKPTEEQIAAAEKIQDAYRAYSARKQALKAVANLRRRFLAARNDFTLPSSLDYDVSTDGRATTSVSVDPASMRDLPSPSALEAEDPFENVPRLAYTPTNAQHHAYEEELNRILNALDAVESHGDLGVRGARRELARAVEREADRVERWRAVVWKWWTQREAEKEKAAAPAQPEAQPVVEPAEVKMDVEPPEQPVQQTAATVREPTPTTTTTTDAAPMEVEPTSTESTSTTQAPVSEPSPVVQAAESPAPEVDIPDADAAAVESQLAPPQIVVQPPSREEPQSESDPEPPVPETQPQQSSAPTTAAPAPDVANPAPESPVQPQPEATERPATPALSHEGEGDMEVEPEEAMTPPPGTPTPFVAVDSGSPDHPQETKVPQVQQQPHQDEPMHKRPPHPTVVDEAEEELREHEMLQ
ncbi:hypothetical protein L226DRAFT_361066 [Lentinus tigrinus ALCF2SS1-7]|uniref:uncharacterized protein n=1 Tax=Lentinus tigrinus ALCF2SS1-7 TaxID=1328758 RepID=UPI0011661EED|nr:hypothetical protein L226DRAFT_361066 [Lentinus tigrinus ALCF2SS1-7]